MKSFEQFKIYLRRVGLLHRNSSASEKLEDFTSNCVVLSICAIYWLTASWFFVFTAQTLIQHTESFFFSSTAALIALWYLICLWYKERHAEMFERIDEIMEKSELYENVWKMNFWREKIEKMEKKN